MFQNIPINRSVPVPIPIQFQPPSVPTQVEGETDSSDDDDDDNDAADADADADDFGDHAHRPGGSPGQYAADAQPLHPAAGEGGGSSIYDESLMAALIQQLAQIGEVTLVRYVGVHMWITFRDGQSALAAARR